MGTFLWNAMFCHFLEETMDFVEKNIILGEKTSDIENSIGIKEIFEIDFV